MSLLKNEQEASEFVSKIGNARAAKILTALCNRSDRRAKALPDCVGFHAHCYKVWLPWEEELVYKLKLGLQINDTENTPEAARQRNLARRKKRAEKIALSKVA